MLKHPLHYFFPFPNSHNLKNPLQGKDAQVYSDHLPLKYDVACGYDKTIRIVSWNIMADEPAQSVYRDYDDNGNRAITTISKGTSGFGLNETPEDYDQRLTRIAEALGHFSKSTDVIALQEAPVIKENVSWRKGKDMTAEVKQQGEKRLIGFITKVQKKLGTDWSCHYSLTHGGNIIFYHNRLKCTPLNFASPVAKDIKPHEVQAFSISFIDSFGTSLFLHHVHFSSYTQQPHTTEEALLTIFKACPTTSAVVVLGDMNCPVAPPYAAAAKGTERVFITSIMSYESRLKGNIFFDRTDGCFFRDRVRDNSDAFLSSASSLLPPSLASSFLSEEKAKDPFLDGIRQLGGTIMDYEGQPCELQFPKEPSVDNVVNIPEPGYQLNAACQPHIFKPHVCLGPIFTNPESAGAVTEQLLNQWLAPAEKEPSSIKLRYASTIHTDSKLAIYSTTDQNLKPTLEKYFPVERQDDNGHHTYYIPDNLDQVETVALFNIAIQNLAVDSPLKVAAKSVQFLVGELSHTHLQGDPASPTSLQIKDLLWGTGSTDGVLWLTYDLLSLQNPDYRDPKKVINDYEKLTAQAQGLSSASGKELAVAMLWLVRLTKLTLSSDKSSASANSPQTKATSTPVAKQPDLLLTIERHPSFLFNEKEGLPALLKLPMGDYKPMLEGYAPHTRHQQATRGKGKKAQHADLFDLQHYIEVDGTKVFRKDARKQLRKATHGLILSTLDEFKATSSEEKEGAVTSKTPDLEPLKQTLNRILIQALAKEQALGKGGEFADILQGLQNNLDVVIFEYQRCSKLFQQDLQTAQAQVKKEQGAKSTYQTTLAFLRNQSESTAADKSADQSLSSSPSTRGSTSLGTVSVNYPGTVLNQSGKPQPKPGDANTAIKTTTSTTPTQGFQ